MCDLPSTVTASITACWVLGLSPTRAGSSAGVGASSGKPRIRLFAALMSSAVSSGCLPMLPICSAVGVVLSVVVAFDFSPLVVPVEVSLRPDCSVAVVLSDTVELLNSVPLKFAVSGRTYNTPSNCWFRCLLKNSAGTLIQPLEIRLSLAVLEFKRLRRFSPLGVITRWIAHT